MYVRTVDSIQNLDTLIKPGISTITSSSKDTNNKKEHSNRKENNVDNSPQSELDKIMAELQSIELSGKLNQSSIQWNTLIQTLKTNGL